jgi:subtilisin-like proprotein convertase family protein
MNVTKLTSMIARATIGLLAAGTGLVTLSSTPANALSHACQVTNDRDVIVSIMSTLQTISTIDMPYCQPGVGWHVRVDVKLHQPFTRNLILTAITPDGSQRKLQDGSLTTAEVLTHRWTTSAASPPGTWKLLASDNIYSGYSIDSWTLTVIAPACWRVNYDDVTSDPSWTEYRKVTVGLSAQIWEWVADHPPTPASTSVWVSGSCGYRASSDMAIGVRLKNADFGGYSLKLYRNGVEVPMTRRYELGDPATGIWVWLNADGSQLAASGTWTLEVTTAADKSIGVTMDSWVLHTSY